MGGWNFKNETKYDKNTPTLHPPTLAQIDMTNEWNEAKHPSFITMYRVKKGAYLPKHF